MLKPETEQGMFARGYRAVGGIDEAGRGPLAGPVVAVCIIANPDLDLSSDRLKDVKDSKRLSEKKRYEVCDLIREVFPAIGVGICDHKTIDRINILEATFLAMKIAINALRSKPDLVLVDGRMPIPNMSLAQQAIICGDNKVLTIAAASIVAKVTRDKIMLELHKEYPQYGFVRHKGYGTKEHLASLKKHGPCPVHRQSFAPVKILLS
ncbi:ribonuclease HII [bacterium]|nr:ribonuclease HII [bacterium]